MKNLVNLILLCCSLRLGFSVFTIFLRFLSLNKFRWKNYLMSCSSYIRIIILIITINTFWTSRSCWFIKLAYFTFSFVLFCRTPLTIDKCYLLVLKLDNYWFIYHYFLFRIRLWTLISSCVMIWCELSLVKVNIRCDTFTLVWIFLALTHYILPYCTFVVHSFLVTFPVVIIRALDKRFSLISFLRKLYLISVNNNLVYIIWLNLSCFVKLHIIKCLIWMVICIKLIFLII
jgi:hypothetical protein